MKKHILDILFCIKAHIGRSLPDIRAGNQLSGMVLKSRYLAIIALGPPLPARIRPGKGPPALCLTLAILLHIRVRICVSVELCTIEISGVEIAPIVPRKRQIGTNRVSAIRRGTSCSWRKQATGRVVDQER